MSGFDFQKKDIAARTGEVSTPSPSPSPAIETPVQKPKGPSIFLKDDRQNTSTSSNTPIPMTGNENIEKTPVEDVSAEIKEPEKTPEIKLEEDFAIYAKENKIPNEIDFEGFIAELMNKDIKDLTPRELEFLEGYKTNFVQTSVSVESEKQTSDTKMDEKTKARIDEYKSILNDTDPKMTPYMKNSKIMDLYLSEHDPKYQKLKTPKAKQQYRDSIIHDFMEAVSTGAKTQAQRRIIQLDIAQVFMDCEAKGENPLELRAQGAAAMKSRVDTLNNAMATKITEAYSKLHIEDLDLDSMSADEAVFTIGKKLALLENPDFEKKYPTIDAQKKAITNQVNGMLKEYLGIECSDDNKDIIFEIGKNVYKEVLQSSDGNIGNALMKLKKDTVAQNELLANIFTNHPEIIENAKTDDDRAILLNIKTRSEIYMSLADNRTDKKITENDIYNELKRLNKTGSITKEQANLLEFYTKMEQLCDGEEKMLKHMFNQEPRFDSLIAKAALSNMSIDKYIDAQLVDADGKQLTGKVLDNKYIELLEAARRDQNYDNIMFLLQSMKKHGIPEEKRNQLIASAFDKAYVYTNAARGNHNAISNGANWIANNCKDKAKVEAYGSAMQTSLKVLDNESATALSTAIHTNIFDDYITRGINMYKSAQDAIDITKGIVNNNNVSDERKSSFTSSLVRTADTQRQITYSNELSKLDNKAVNEGLAAAENYVDKSVRAQYSKNIDNSIARMEQSGKYSKEEIAQMKKDIQQARETGMTKSEAAQAKKDQQEVKASTQKAQQQQKAEQKAQKEALEQKKQTVLNYAKEVMTKALPSVQTTTSASVSSPSAVAAATVKEQVAKEQATKEQVAKELNQTIEKLAKAQSVAEANRIKEELLQRIENFQAEVRRSQEEREIMLSEQEALNAFVTDPDVSETEDETAAEAVAVVTDSTVTAEDGTSASVRSNAEASGLSVQTVQELQEAYKSGGITALYEKATTLVGSKAQERLLNYISHTSSSTLHSFADAHSGNKNVLMTLFKNSKDPYIMQLLIRNGYASEVLANGTITVKDFVSYASPSTVANWIADLQKQGATYTLKEAFENLDSSIGQTAEAMQPGSDAWLKARQLNMADASIEQDDFAQTDSSGISSGISSYDDIYDENGAQIALNGATVSNWKLQQGRKRYNGPFHMIG